MTSLLEFIHIWDTATPPTGALAVAGALTRGNADALRESIDTRLGDDTAIRRLRVDCGGVTECDSEGMSTLLALRRRADDLGVEFQLAPASTVLTSVMARTGADLYLLGEPVQDTPGSGPDERFPRAQ